MLFLTIVETVLLLVVAVFFVTQLIGPVAYGRPVMPMFRRKNVKLERQLETTNEELDQEKIVAEIRRRQEQLKKKREWQQSTKTETTTTTKEL